MPAAVDASHGTENGLRLIWPEEKAAEHPITIFSHWFDNDQSKWQITNIIICELIICNINPGSRYDRCGSLIQSEVHPVLEPESAPIHRVDGGMRERSSGISDVNITQYNFAYLFLYVPGPVPIMSKT